MALRGVKAGNKLGGIGGKGSKKQDLNPIQFAVQQATEGTDRFRKGYLEALDRDAGALRSSILRASPEMARINSYLSDRFDNPIPQQLAAGFEDRIRTAQAARGFGGGGTGVAGEEARFLFGVAEQQRQQLLPAMGNFGQQILQMSGLGGAQTMTAEQAHAISLSASQNRTARKNAQAQRNIGYINAAVGAIGAVSGFGAGGGLGSQLIGGGGGGLLNADSRAAFNNYFQQQLSDMGAGISAQRTNGAYNEATRNFLGNYFGGDPYSDAQAQQVLRDRGNRGSVFGL